MMDNKRTLAEALQVVFIYAGLATLYIFFSDALLAVFINESARATRVAQTVKGIAFVLCTASLLYLLIRRMEKRLQSYDERYRGIFLANPLPTWIYCRETLKILLVNKAAEVNYGYSHSEFLKLSIDDLRPPTEPPRFCHEIENARPSSEEHLHRGVWQHCKQNGELMWVDVTSHALEYEGRAAELVVAKDITRDVEADEMLRLNAEVFDNSQEGIMVCDKNNCLIQVNRAFETITGYSREEIIGKSPSTLNSGRQDTFFYEQMWSSLQSEGKWQGELWNRHKDGHVYPERLSVSTIKDKDGHIDKVIGVFWDASAEKDAEARIDFLAHYDPLTNLPNRSLLMKAIRETISTGKSTRTELAILMLDLDRFKHVNDGLGFETGNKLLHKISRRLTNAVGDGDTVYRLGGDEFALLLPGRDIQQAAHIADQILTAVRKPFEAQDHQISFTTSIGIAHYPQNGSDPDLLVQRAESALYRVKNAGRNTYEFFDESSQSQSLESLKIENGLRNAIENNELTLHYQPQYDAATRKISGFEALIRWQHPEWGMISPGEFIPVAEESGQIIPLGEWIIETAVTQARTWQRDHGLLVPVAINISVIQFRREDFYDQIVSVLERSQLPPELLCLEITESVAMAGTDLSVRLIDRLHDIGVNIAIDDFGSGYSSLSYLKHMKVEKLKIDQVFVRDLGRDSRDDAIVTSIIHLAHSLGFKTIAEGVETAAQYESLRGMGCNQIQGYYFARPMPTENVTDLLADIRAGMLGSSALKQ